MIHFEKIQLTGQLLRNLLSMFGWIIGVTISANSLFFAFSVLAVGDTEVIEKRVRTAFETGELGLKDYLPYNNRLGWHQYNDCNVLQMLSNPDSTRLKKALAPIIYKADPQFNRACPVLFAIVMEGKDREELLNFRYARYWHGNNVLASIALRFMELKDYRKLLTLLVWLGILTLWIVTFKLGPSLRRTGLAICLSSTLVWAVPAFSPGLTHGPGEAFMLFALAGITVYDYRSTHLFSVVPVAAAFGALIVFFSVLTGLIPVAASWLVVLTFAARRDRQQAEGIRPPAAALITLFAFGVGVFMSVILKQLLAILLAEPTTTTQFLAQLRQYIGVPDSDGFWPGFVLPYVHLIRQSHILTYGNMVASYVSLSTLLLAWLAAVIRGLKYRYTVYGRDILFISAVALIPFIWVLFWLNHTLIHAVFMVRIFVIPYALVPLAYIWSTKGRLIYWKREPF
jgi:hypothetical protein